jgi:hypothetical protein
MIWVLIKKSFAWFMVITGSLVSYVIVKYMIPMKRKEKKKPAVRLFNSATDNYTEYFYI